MKEPKWYVHEPEVWDRKKCLRMAKSWHRDGMGTKHHRQGYIGNHYGYIRYNGGFSPHQGPMKGTYFTLGEVHPLPIIETGFQLVRVANWGWYIEKTDTQ